MKKLLSIFVLCIITNVGLSQITVIKEPEPQKQPVAESFPSIWDSTTRFFYDPSRQNIDFLKQYIGQELYYFSDSRIYKEVPNNDTTKYKRVYNDTILTSKLMKIIDINNTNNEFIGASGSWYFELASEKDTIYYIPSNNDFTNDHNSPGLMIYYKNKGKTRILRMRKRGYSSLKIPDKNKFVGRFIKIEAYGYNNFIRDLSIYIKKKPFKFAIITYEFNRGKMLKIIDAKTNTNNTVTIAFDNSCFNWDWYLKLSDNDSNYYYIFNPSKNFCLLGFIKKSKEIYCNKTFYVKTNKSFYDVWDNFLSGTKSEKDKYFVEGAPWTCKDVVIIDKQDCESKINKVMLLLENPSGYKLYVYFPQYLKRNKVSKKIVTEIGSTDYNYNTDVNIDNDFYTQDEYKVYQNKKREKIKEQQRKNKLIKQKLIYKYGDFYGNLIYKGEIVVGMTKEMCVAAKGEPIIKKYVETGYGRIDEWKYDIFNNSVYFKKNKIIMINW